MSDLSTFVDSNIGPIVGLLGLLVVLLLAVAFVLARRVARLERTLAAITRGEDGRSLAAVLEAHLDKVYKVARQLEGLTKRTDRLELDGRRAFQRLGLVRFNPFEDTGGNQSFALVLLDAEDDGIVVSSLHSRNATRVYAKAVAKGTAEAALSEEETEALRRATRG